MDAKLKDLAEEQATDNAKQKIDLESDYIDILFDVLDGKLPCD